MSAVPKRVVRYIAAAVCTFIFSLATAAQSTDPNFPTAVTTNEIDGTIKARDIGDSRVTSYYYAFDSGQGDVFVNVVTSNFSGDIDVFAQDGLRPLTKMVIYPDNGPNETGRVVYMRKPERLLLRIEGRSPNDDPATFRIKFAGSFLALAPQKELDTPTIRPTEINPDSGERVNSVGTIVEVRPKPKPTVEAKPIKETVAVSKQPPPSVTRTAKPAGTETTTDKKSVQAKPASKPPTKEPPVKQPEETATNPPPPTSVPKKEPARAGPGEVATILKKPAKSKSAPVAKPAPKKKTPPPAEPKPNPLASIHLIVLFKDGNVIQRPMSEVQKFSIDNGQLTVVTKDGASVKYSILDVAKVTIE